MQDAAAALRFEWLVTALVFRQLQALARSAQQREALRAAQPEQLALGAA
jgi:hypothetical protein